MDYGLGFLSTYITAAELVGKTVTLTIQRVTLEKIESLKIGEDDAAGRMKDRIVIHFKEAKDGRGWLLNRTNAEALREMWGRETDNWLGKRVTLHTQQVRVGAKVEPGIRVKGSPELKAAHTFQLKLPRKKPQPYTLLPTGRETGSASSPEVDTATGEVRPTSDLPARLSACQTLKELNKLKPEVAATPENTEEGRLVRAIYNAKLEDFAAAKQPASNQAVGDTQIPGSDAVAGLVAMTDDIPQ